ncbi:hypothetical protein [Pseudomonas fluorescens]|jgi:hypothetical protein|uniref:hypothetical protein n=1 Tax=Pseudomonas fluorescens TaxID=294 RepID=UPI00068BC1C8|nr:hypothetical protein [Pseudomonas fluorescens]
MSDKELATHLNKLLNRQQISFIKSINDLLYKICGESISQKKTQASLLLEELENLKGLAPDSKCPTWVANLQTILFEFSQSKIDSSTLILGLVDMLPAIKSHQWMMLDIETQGFDFEEIFNECRLNSKIPELFDSIITLLEQICEIDELDSRSMVEALTKVIATLKLGKTSSRFSLEGSWQFLCGFLENYFWVEAKKIPGLGSIVEALEKTIKDTQIELYKLNSDVQETMTKRVKEEVKFLRQSSAPVFKTYEKNGQLSLAYRSSGDAIEA